MIRFGGPELRCGLQRRGDCLRDRLLLFFKSLSRQARLTLVLRKNHRAILRSDIPTLSVFLGRVMAVEKDLEQAFIGRLCFVILDFDGLGVACPSRTDLRIGRILNCPAI